MDYPDLLQEILGEFNIRVNSVVPGWVMTQRQIDLWLNDESEKELMKRQCLKEKLMPHELAQAVLFFHLNNHLDAQINLTLLIKAGYNRLL